MPEIKLPNSEQIQQIINVLNEDKMIFGVYWDKSSNPTLVRTDASIGLEANVGKDGQLAKNDFDNMPIYRDIGEHTDELGNVFIKIPKFYIQKVEGNSYRRIRISKTRYPGFYLPWVFWDFENGIELDYYLHGKHKASLSADNKLESKSNTHPLVGKNIVDFRNYAAANNDEINGLKGYQQLDIHAQDVIQTLFTVEFATLNSQSVLQGFASGRISESDKITVAEIATNRAIVSNGTANNFRVGQSITVNNSIWNNTESRLITNIESYDADNTAIYFDGEPIDTLVGDFISNRGWVNGFSRDIASSSGYIVANDGKYPCSYRGIESPFGDLWQFVDGINITDNQTWVCKDANQYASNVFASPYEKLGFINANSNGYSIEMGFDPNYPFAQFPTNLGGNSATYYSDYYYQNSGQRIALVGGAWYHGSSAGLWYWYLPNSSSAASVSVGGRLLKKAL